MPDLENQNVNGNATDLHNSLAMRDLITILLLCGLLTIAADAAYMRGKYLGAYYPQWVTARLQNH